MNGWCTFGSCLCKPVAGRVERRRAGEVRERLLKWKAKLAVVGTENVVDVDTVCPTVSATADGFSMMRLVMSLMCCAACDVMSSDLVRITCRTLACAKSLSSRLD